METDAKKASVSAIVDNFFLLNAFTGFPHAIGYERAP